MPYQYYTLREVQNIFNTMVDDYLDLNDLLIFVNFGIAKVNSKCKTTFPRFTENDNDEEYTAIPDFYIDNLVLEIARWRFKHKEEDYNGALSFQSTLEPSFKEFENNFIINGEVSEEYLISNTATSYESNFDNDFMGW